jgi:hypothetical protein
MSKKETTRKTNKTGNNTLRNGTCLVEGAVDARIELASQLLACAVHARQYPFDTGGGFVEFGAGAGLVGGGCCGAWVLDVG